MTATVRMLSPMQRIALRHLARAGTTRWPEVSSLTLTRRAGTIRVLDGLVDKGLAERDDDLDAELRAWRITDAGRIRAEELPGGAA